MPSFQLFRMRIKFPQQPSLFQRNESSSVILYRAINEKPSLDVGKALIWHIGNIIQLDENSIFFAFGRTTPSKLERFDLEKGDFREEEFSTAPYTYIVFDYILQICAIAEKRRLAPKVSRIAKRLALVLKSSQIATNGQLEIEIPAINDPGDFIT